MRMPGTMARVLLVLGLCAATGAAAQTLVSTDFHERVVVALHVRTEALQAWLPEGWVPAEVAEGPDAGANLLLNLVDLQHAQDPQGRRLNANEVRYAVLVALARPVQGGEGASFVIRVYTSNRASLPGAYGNAVAGQVTREVARRGEGTDPGQGSERWQVSDPAGGRIDLALDWRRSALERVSVRAQMRSALQPGFSRTYEMERGVDRVRSRAAGIDTTQRFELRVRIGELAGLFDGSETVQGIAVMPWSLRRIVLP